MAETATWIEAARRVLRESGRPLSLRKILAIGERDGLFANGTPELDAFRDAIRSAPSGREPVVEVRRGVYGLGESVAETPRRQAAPTVVEVAEEIDLEEEFDDFDDQEEDEGGRRRRRRRRAADLVGSESAAPTSVEEAVAVAAQAPDRDRLRSRLWERMRSRAAAVVDAEASEPAAEQAPATKRESAAGDGRGRRENAAPTRAEAAPPEATRAAARPERAPESAAPPEGDRATARLARPTDAAPTKAEAPRAARSSTKPTRTPPAAAARAEDAPRAAAPLTEDAPRAAASKAEPAPRAAAPKAEPAPRAAAPRAPEPEAGDEANLRRAIGERLKARRAARGEAAPPAREPEAVAPPAPAAMEPPPPPAVEAAPPPAAIRVADPSSVKARLRARYGRGDASPDEARQTGTVPVAEVRAARVDERRPAEALTREPRRDERPADGRAPVEGRRDERRPAEVRRDERRPAEMRPAEPAREGRRPDAGRREEPRREERRPAEVRPAEPAREERRPDAGRREEPRREEHRPAEARREEPRRDERRPEPRRDDRRPEPRRDELRSSAPRLEERRPPEARTAESRPAEGRRDEAARAERRPEGRPPEARGEEQRSTADRPAEPRAAQPMMASPSETAAAPGERPSLRDRLRARFSERREQTPSPVETVQAAAATVTEAPYRERRQTPAPAPAPEAERRGPALPEIAPTDVLVSRALAALERSGRPLPIDALGGGSESRGVRAALLAENARRSAAGLRAPFVVYFNGTVGLSAWGLSERFLQLEETIQAATAEQREIVRRDLLARVAGLGDTAFEQVVVMLLEQIGYANVRVVHREAGGNLALLATYDQGSAALTSAVVARRAWKTIGRDTVRALREGLAQFGASRGVVLTVGTFGPDARDEAARTDRPTLVLVDGAGLARLLYDQGIGLATVRPVVRSVDAAFFESLE